MTDIKKIIEEVKKTDKEYHYFNLISEELALGQAKELEIEPKGRLNGMVVSVKDCICVEGVESRAGSKILSGYKPVFDATVIEKIKKEGAVIAGKTSQDEFGFGGFSVNMGLGFKIPLNPFDKERACGGSSGGKCEVSKDIPCAWQMIHDRLEDTGRLDALEPIMPIKDWSVSVSGGPRMVDVDAECGIVITGKTPAETKTA